MDDKEPPDKPTRPGAGGGGSKTWPALAATAACLVVVFALVATPYIATSGSYRLGYPSPDTVTATRSFQVEDADKTEAERNRRKDEVKRIYVDSRRGLEATTNLHEALVALESWHSQGLSSEEIRALAAGRGLELDTAEIELYLGSDDEMRLLLERSAAETLAYLESEPISAENINEVRVEARRMASELPVDEAYRRLAGSITASFVATNTDYPASYVQAEMERQAQLVPTFFEQVNEGEVIVNKGEIITAITLRKLEKSRVLATSFSLRRLLGIFLALAAIAAIMYAFLLRKKSRRYLPSRIELFYPVVLIMFTLLARLFSVLAEGDVLWGFLIPVPLVAMLTMMMLGRETALAMTALSTVITGFMLKGDFALTATALMGGLFTVVLFRRADRREDLLRQGLLVSGAMGLASFSVALAFFDTPTALGAMGMGAANGMLSSVLALGMLPILEKVLGATTPMRLLELASPDAPLLKELISKAPGTYNHSLMLGNLVEAAARAVGADPLLARVAAYYHDVGKIEQPSFFIENRERGGGGYEDLAPEKSALLVAAHVDNGVELARRYNLPEEITDIIRQHHGTMIIKYFYAQALERRRNGEREEEVEEGFFRYHGEKPRSKEAAIIMLGDALEAALRSPGPDGAMNPEKVIGDVIDERRKDGQLDECELTLRDLELVRRSFVEVTSGAGHERVQYPVLQGEGG